MGEVWCLVLWEERRVGVFENVMLRGIFVAKREEVIGRQNIIARNFIICDVLHMMTKSRRLIRQGV
jgi:hypothetical protein